MHGGCALAKHYLLGPSSADRWTTCPGSLFGQVVVSRPSAASEEGSCCHALLCLTLKRVCVSHPTLEKESIPVWYAWGDKTTLGVAVETAISWASTFVDRLWTEFDPEATAPVPVTVEMVDAVQLFLSTVCELIAEHSMTDPRVSTEAERTSGLWSAPSGDTEIEQGTPLFGGTADCVLYCPETGVLCILDLKFGRKPVHASGLQTTAYALLVMEWMAQQAPDIRVRRVVQVVVQPRCNPSVSKFVPGQTDIHLAYEKIGRAANDVLERWHRLRLPLQTGDESLLTAGPHCQYCPRAMTCPMQQDAVLQEISVGVIDDASGQPSYALTRDLTVDQLLWLSERADAMRDFLSRVERALYERAVAGVPIPGRKLIAKYGHRAWAPGANVVAVLTVLYGDGEYERREPVSPAQAEKIIKSRRQDWSLVQDTIVHQPIRGLALVREDAKGQQVLPEAAQTWLIDNEGDEE